MLVPGAIAATFAGERDERARARRAAAGRGHPDDHRQRRLEQRLDDLAASRRGEPPGVSSLMTTAGAPSRGRAAMPSCEVARPSPGRRCRSSAARRPYRAALRERHGAEHRQHAEHQGRQREHAPRAEQAADGAVHQALDGIIARRASAGRGTPLELVEDELAPRLQPVAAPPPPPSTVANAPSSLCVSRMATGRPAASTRRPGRGGPRPTGSVSSLSSAEQPERGLPRPRSSSSRTRAGARRAHAAVLRVQVPADADRVAVVEPRVAARLERRIRTRSGPVADDEVRDDLLAARIRLGLRARPVVPVPPDGVQDRLRAVRSHAAPRRHPKALAEEPIARHAQDLFLAQAILPPALVPPFAHR